MSCSYYIFRLKDDKISHTYCNSFLVSHFSTSVRILSVTGKKFAILKETFDRLNGKSFEEQKLHFIRNELSDNTGKRIYYSSIDNRKKHETIKRELALMKETNPELFI